MGAFTDNDARFALQHIEGPKPANRVPAGARPLRVGPLCGSGTCATSRIAQAAGER